MLTNTLFNSTLKTQTKLTSKLITPYTLKHKLITKTHNIKQFTSKTFKKKHLNFPKSNSLSKTTLFINNSFFNFSKKSDPKENYLEDEDIRDIEFYIPKEALVFKNQKCIIALANSEQRNFVKKVSIANNCLNGLFGYKVISSIYYSSIIKTLFYLIPFAIFIYSSFAIKINKMLLIQSISLYEDGKTLEIEVINDKFKVKIGKLKILNKENGLELNSLINLFVFKDYFPLKIKGKPYLLPKKLDINNREILGAIVNGQYISLEEGEKQIDGDKTIDV